MKLKIGAFGLTCGLVWGFGLLAMTWWIIAFNGVTHETLLIGKLYLGYDVSPLGSVIGLAWGFGDGLVCGLIFAWIYNGLSGCTRHGKKAQDDTATDETSVPQ